MIREVLDGRRGIYQTGRHYEKLIMRIMSLECCLLDIFLNYSNLVIDTPQVQSREVVRTI